MKAEVLRHIALPLAILFCPALQAQPHADDPGSSPEAELDGLVALAMDSNPRVTAARQLLSRAVAEHRGVLGFFDPRLTAACGRSDWVRDVPGGTGGVGLQNNSAVTKLGIEMPVRPGAYFSFGMAERYLLEPEEEYDSLYQSLVGTRIRIPLARDRVLAEWRTSNWEAMHQVAAAAHHLAAVAQDVRREVELTYVDALRTTADVEEVRASTARVRKLLSEARELVRAKAIPEYQLFAARLEATLGDEEIQAVEHVQDEIRIRLAELIGETEPLKTEQAKDALIAWASTVKTNQAPVSLEEACFSRGLYREAKSYVRATEAACRLAGEALKPDIDLSVSATWQTEDPDSIIGRETLLSDEELGTEAAIIYRRPFFFRTERAEMNAARAAVEVKQSELRQARLRVAADLERARRALRSAHSRLTLVRTAVGDASGALSAEQERFRLGEGRSRNVLDAQKDLTKTIRRQNNAAAALLRARVELSHAAGYRTTRRSQSGPR